MKEVIFGFVLWFFVLFFWVFGRGGVFGDFFGVFFGFFTRDIGWAGGSSFKLEEGRSKFGIRKKRVLMRVVGHWNREQMGHRCFILGVFEDQVGWCSEQPDLLKDVHPSAWELDQRVFKCQPQTILY